MDEVSNRPTELDLINFARSTALVSNPPYSHRLAGCVVESVDGEFMTGAIDQLYGEPVCAEMQALMAARALFGLDKVARIVIAVGFRDGAALAGDEVQSPCLKCCQYILKVVELTGRDIDIILSNGKGSKIERHHISTLIQ